MCAVGFMDSSSTGFLYNWATCLCLSKDTLLHWLRNLNITDEKRAAPINGFVKQN
jgi:hypothetical protein